jgi:hypothetical protein
MELKKSFFTSQQGNQALKPTRQSSQKKRIVFLLLHDTITIRYDTTT